VGSKHVVLAIVRCNKRMILVVCTLVLEHAYSLRYVVNQTCVVAVMSDAAVLDAAVLGVQAGSQW